MDPVIVAYVLAIAGVVAGAVWFVRYVIRMGTMSPREAAKYEMRREARALRDGEAILQARAKLDAEGWKP